MTDHVLRFKYCIGGEIGYRGKEAYYITHYRFYYHINNEVRFIAAGFIFGFPLKTYFSYISNERCIFLSVIKENLFFTILVSAHLQNHATDFNGLLCTT